jgi:hypothetical protein
LASNRLRLAQKLHLQWCDIELVEHRFITSGRTLMQVLMFTPVLAAAGWSLIYLLMGGGLGGAIVIFIVLKMLGK